MITADIFIDLNTADVLGTQLTGAIALAGSRGAVSGTADSGTMTGCVLAASQSTRLDGITVRTVGQFPIGYATRAMKLDNANAAAAITVDVAVSVYKALSIGGFVTLGWANEGASGGIIELFGVFNQSGHFAVAQLNNGHGTPGGPYDINIESDPGGVTTHSSVITLVPGTQYWVTLKADFVSGVCQLAVYSTAGVLVGSVTSTVDPGGAFVTGVDIGNTQGNTFPTSTFTYWESFVIDVTSALFPLGPIGSPQADYNARRHETRPAAFKPGLAR
jgi:hypothetical protein